MSSPIKPPSGPKGAPGAEDAGGVDETRRPDRPSEAFRQTLDRTAGTEAAGEAARAAGTGPVAEVAADLRAGRIDVDTAVDRLVEHALRSQMAEALPPARRAELEAFLRRSLADDPTLVALTGDLERGD